MTTREERQSCRSLNFVGREVARRGGDLEAGKVVQAGKLDVDGAAWVPVSYDAGGGIDLGEASALVVAVGAGVRDEGEGGRIHVILRLREFLSGLALAGMAA